MNDLQQVFGGVAIDQEEISMRLKFLQWSESDKSNLYSFADKSQAFNCSFVEKLYSHMANFEIPYALISKPDVLQRLKSSQLEYYEKLWRSPRNHEYVAERLRVGWVHEKVGLEMKWYLGAYCFYLHEMLDEIFKESADVEIYKSLLKAIFFDMGLAIEAYSAEQNIALEASDARYKRALKGSNDGIWDWKLDQDFLYLSERWISMLGLAREQLSGKSKDWFSIVHPEDISGLKKVIEESLTGSLPAIVHQYRIRHQDGHYLWVMLRGVLTVDKFGDVYLAGSQSDISQQKLIEQDLHYAAKHDPLTGLCNRSCLLELLKQAQLRSVRPGARHGALLFIDLDRFKVINDNFGHAVGDQVLIAVTGRLQKCLRSGDNLARLGGDEFVALLDDLAQPEDAEIVAQHMLDELKKPLNLDKNILRVSASIGIADLADLTDENNLRAADLAMYLAKGAGKSRFARYSADLHAQSSRRHELEDALAKALELREFNLEFQPIFAIEGGVCRVSGFEALLRWRYKEYLVPPDEFIPILEESGYIVPVGEWVIKCAMEACKSWQHLNPGVYCSVNICARQIQETNFVYFVNSVISNLGLSSDCLVLEITERQIMDYRAETLACLREIDSLGIRVALDDFGTGYSSLGYLRRFPISIIKIDKSFINNIGSEAAGTVLTNAIIELGRRLGMQVIAEGVESKSQLDFLQQHICVYSQGYLFSRPLSASQAKDLLLKKEWLVSELN